MGGNIGTAEQSRAMSRTPAPVRITISRNTARSPGDSGDRQSAGGSGALPSRFASGDWSL